MLGCEQLSLPREGLPWVKGARGLPLEGLGRRQGIGFCQGAIPSSFLIPIPGMLHYHLLHR